MNRLHIRNETHLCEWADTPTGHMQARAFRRSHPAFKGRKIRAICQLMPSQVECGTIYAITYR